MSPIEKAVRDMFETAKENAVKNFKERYKEDIEAADEEVRSIKDEISDMISYGTCFEDEAERYVRACKDRYDFDKDLMRIKNSFSVVEHWLFPEKEEDEKENKKADES